MNRFTVLVSVAALLVAGCETPGERLNAPPHGTSADVNPLQGTFVYMHDNALLEDMTVCDYHFVPHRPMLNALGEERLDRLAALIEEYGGTIRYNSDLSDDGLLRQRTDSVVRYLSDIGVDTRSQIVKPDLPGGAGLGAVEVILIKQNEGTYRPRRAAGSAGASASGGSSSSSSR